MDATCALSLQALLIGNFAARIWKPIFELQWGWLIYTIIGIPAVILTIAFIVTKQPFMMSAALLLTFIWAAFGFYIDIIHPVDWRGPPIVGFIFIPYVTLFIGSQLALWIPLWYVKRVYWIAFGVMYAIHTLLNILSHFKSA